MKAKNKTQYILYTGNTQSWRPIIEKHIQEKNLNWKIISLVPDTEGGLDLPETEYFKQIKINFEDSEIIKKTIMNLHEGLVAAVNRGERNIPLFKKIIPYLPEHILVPSAESLTRATEKTAMRKAFWRYDKKITPKCTS